MDNELMALQNERSVVDVKAQVKKIQDLMDSVMKKGEHYGVIPGTSGKPSLFKAGAEKLNFVFRLTPDFDIDRHDMENGHREYSITCRLRSIATGEIVGTGVGSCSTMEKKYRYRKDRNGRREENPDIADVYNTVLKMAKKRAHVDATITACAASDIFTQDIEDFVEHGPEPAPRNVTPKKTPDPDDAKHKLECEKLLFKLHVGQHDRDNMWKDAGHSYKTMLGILSSMEQAAISAEIDSEVAPAQEELY